MIIDALEIIQERAGDIAFAHEARRIFDVTSRAVKKRMFAVMVPNHAHDYLSRWNGVHVNVRDLGIADVFPEVLQDLVLVFAWGTPDDPLSGAYYMSPQPGLPDGGIMLAYNIGKADRQPFRLSKASKRARAKLSQMTKNAEMGADEDIIELIPKLLDARRTAFIHELRHAYDDLVRDDEGKMSDYMASSTKSASDDEGEEGYALNFTSDDEMNAYITHGIEDTIEDFEKHSRGRPTKAKAKQWAPNGTALWKRFTDNVSGGVKHYAGEDKLMRRAAARVADVWDDYVQNLSEAIARPAEFVMTRPRGAVNALARPYTTLAVFEQATKEDATLDEALISEAFEGLELVKLIDPKKESEITWGLLRNDDVVGGMVTDYDAESGYDKVETMWANSAPATYALLVSALDNADSQGFIPSNDVSPAARAVIKRWYDTYRDDPDYVEHGVVNNSPDLEYLNAGYKAGPRVRSIAHLSHVSDDRLFISIRNAVDRGFHKAYNDDKRSKKTLALDDAVRRRSWKELYDWLEKFMYGTPKERDFLKSWLTKNRDAVADGVGDSGFEPYDYDRILARVGLAPLKEAIIREVDEDLNDEVEDLMKQPEFKTLENFVEYMYEDERETYTTAELQALARNLYLADNKGVKAKSLASAPSSYRDNVIQQLEGYGLRFAPRRAQKNTRGFSSPLNGSNRFAGNHGGSGFTNAYNREPDSGRTFDPNDKGALRMGSKRR